MLMVLSEFMKVEMIGNVVVMLAVLVGNLSREHLYTICRVCFVVEFASLNMKYNMICCLVQIPASRVAVGKRTKKKIFPGSQRHQETNT